MDLSADEAAAIRFRGTRYAYDRLEVDRFRTRVIATLEAYEAALADAGRRIERLEKLQPRGAARRFAPDPKADTSPAPSAPSPSPVHDRVVRDGAKPGGASSDEVDRLMAWVTRRNAESEVAHLVAQASEDARMIRALAAEQAAGEIARLTEEARREVLDVTTRAARLASDTEDAAHRRAGEILDAAADRSEGEVADMDELSRRIVSLRSSIAAVQDRLDALADEDGATANRTGVIDLDLVEVDAPKKTRRRRRRAGVVAAGTDASGTDELEERVAALRERLENQ